MFNLGRECL